MTEPLTICLLTYERTEYALRTIDAVVKHLVYPDIAWYVSDDGSRPEHIEAVLGRLRYHGQRLNMESGWHSDRLSYGRGANRAVRWGLERGDLILMLEDDWELSRRFEIWNYCAMLMQRPDIGMVRMGYLNSGVGGLSMGFGGDLYWSLDDTHSRNFSTFAFAGHPAIMHKRFFEHYGYYPEAWQPGETELKMCWQCVSGMGPRIVWPAELMAYGPWGHIGAIQSYEWNGGIQLD